jgi:hypothetical protein
VTEAELQAAVIDLARTFQWTVYHTHDSRRSQAGFPDLVMVRDGELIFAELKSEKGKLSPAQREWLRELDMTSVAVYIWRPVDWTSGAIEAVLRCKSRAHLAFLDQVRADELATADHLTRQSPQA